MRNLLSNAIEHGEGGPIEVRVAAGEDAVAVSVRDHGRGLDVADLDRVFDRFWRADPARARTLGGTGLGLSIALRGHPAARWSAGGLGSAGTRGAVPIDPAAGGRTPSCPLTSPLPLDPTQVQV